MTAFLVHGVRVSVEGDAAEYGLALLSGFPPARLDPVDLTVVLRRTGEPVGGDPGARPVFFHGRVRAGERGGVLVLHDGASALTVSADGSRMEGCIHEASLADGGHAFTHVALLLALVVALRHHGLFHAHAAALVAPGGARLLVPGGAGAGKTTLALALAGRGWAYLGDDAVFLAMGPDGPRVLAFPRPFHVAERSLRAFPELVPHAGAAAPSGKRFVEPATVYAGQGRHEMGTPHLLLFPEVVHAPTTSLAPLSGAEAAGALVEASALVVVDAMPGVRAQLDVLRGVADAAQALHVRLGADLLDDPGLVADRLLAAAAAR